MSKIKKCFKKQLVFDESVVGPHYQVENIFEKVLCKVEKGHGRNKSKTVFKKVKICKVSKNCFEKNVKISEVNFFFLKKIWLKNILIEKVKICKIKNIYITSQNI